MDTPSDRSGKREVNFCLLGASFGTDNMGVSALASGTLSSLFHSFPEGRACLLDYSRHPAIFPVHHCGGTTETELINLRFSKKAFLPNNIARLLLTALLLRLVPSGRLKEEIISRNPCLKAIHGADIIGSIAGGDSFSDIYGLGRLLYVSLPQLLVLLLGKPLVLLPQTLGPFESTPARVIARRILRHARAVYARDRESLEEVKTLIGREDGRLRMSYDMAFALEPMPPVAGQLAELRKLENCGPLVGLNVSGLLYKGGYTGDNMFGLKGDYREIVHEIICHFIAQNVQVLLVPHVFGSGADSESDMTASAAIHRSLAAECGGRLHLIDGDFDHHQVKYLIGRCDFFLGSRMHACIGALSQCIPAIGLAYSRKFKGVFATVGAQDLVIELAEDAREEVLRKIATAFQQRAQIRGRLRDRMAHAQASVLGLFARVADFDGQERHAGSDQEDEMRNGSREGSGGVQNCDSMCGKNRSLNAS